MKRVLIVAAATLMGIGLVAAQQGPGIMKSNGKALGTVLSATAKGDKPYSQADIDAAIAVLADGAAKLPTLYPVSLKGAAPSGDYAPSPKVWDDAAGFNAQITAFSAAVANAKATVKDVDTLKAALPGIAKACGACHETYRVKI